jgi:RNA-directed DNA polymerase
MVGFSSVHGTMSINQLSSDFFEKSFEASLYYQNHKQKKKNGKFREICAPQEDLKQLQREIADFLEEEFKDALSADHITGFLKGKSIKNNAKPHLGADWVINLDIKDFFPSIDSTLIMEVLEELKPKKGLLASIFSKNKITNFRKLTPEAIFNIVTLQQRLPQGSPASPIISNIVGVRTIDKMFLDRIDEVKPRGYRAEYTRYADDITISLHLEVPYNKPSLTYERMKIEDMTKVLIDSSNHASKLLSWGFYINEEKTNIKHKSQRQSVTGIVVNNGIPGISKKKRNKIRAILHSLKISNKEIDENLFGLLEFIREINPKQYSQLTKDFPENLLKKEKNYASN